MLPRFSYVRPRTLDEALDHLDGSGARVHAGGTDLLGCLRDRVFAADTLVSLRGVEGLSGIRPAGDGGLVVGGLTTLSEVAADERVRELYPGLAQAAAAVASPQLRNQGTLAGNLCQRPRCWYFRGEFHCAKKGGDRCFAVDGQNRYHAVLGGGPCYIVHPSDTAPMLVALGAAVRVAGPDGGRTIRLEEFFVLPADELERENVLAPGEIITAILLPPAPRLHSSYRKVRERAAWDFALASVALALEVGAGTVTAARVVLGGVAPVPWRSRAAERAIVGNRLEESTARAAAAAAVADADPLAHNGYKVPLIRGLLEESLLAAG